MYLVLDSSVDVFDVVSTVSVVGDSQCTPVDVSVVDVVIVLGGVSLVSLVGVLSVRQFSRCR